MKKYILCALTLFLLLLPLGFDLSAQEPAGAISDSDGIARAKIGIRIASNDIIRRAKAEDRVKAGDELRIYIQPEFEDAMIYVLYHNRQQLVQLHKSRHEAGRARPIILPSEEGQYTVDGQSPEERLTIICSPEPLVQLEEFLQAQAQEPQQSPEAWEELEQALLEQSKLDLSETISKPWSIAGGVRAIDPFLTKLPISSGKTFIIKKYDFLVEE